MRMNYSKFLYVVTFATVLFTACGNDSSTSANNSNDDISSKSSSSQRSVSSSSNKVTEPVEVTVGSMKDSRDGHTYKTVTIGSQTWMAENLNYKADSSWCGGGNELNEGDCSKYGRLYTWAAAMDSAGTWSSNGKGCGYGKTCSPTYPVRGACPEGWHLPSETEWNSLFTAVGGPSIAGTKLKSPSGWNDNEGHDGNGTDAFSFSALPAGDRIDYGIYYYEGDYAHFWGSTESIFSDYAFNVYFSYLSDSASLDYYFKHYAFSVRCLQD